MIEKASCRRLESLAHHVDTRQLGCGIQWNVFQMHAKADTIMKTLRSASGKPRRTLTMAGSAPDRSPPFARQASKSMSLRPDRPGWRSTPPEDREMLVSGVCMQGLLFCRKRTAVCSARWERSAL